ncbi:hypothetical protein ACFVIM_23555 [Streptomyces sp. NPDC057638]|uniref:hypothetical protein n=1 Tax=Streptomyces sp. NPDC057638 TaxID=3346190 RepID=UPI0036C7716F
MTLNAQWQDLFGADAAGARTGTGMTLASAHPAAEGGGGGGGGGAPDLKADQTPWMSAGSVAGELRTGTATALTELTTAQEGVGAATEGFSAAAALAGITPGWKDRLTSVREECGRLDGALKAAGKDFGERETANRNTIASATPTQPKQGG